MMWLGNRTWRLNIGYAPVTCQTLWTRRSGLMRIGLRLSSSWQIAMALSLLLLTGCTALEDLSSEAQSR